MTIDYGSSAGGVFGRPKAMTLVGTNTVTANPSASATVGTAPSVTRNGALSNVASSVKATAGRLFGVAVSNPGAAAAWFNMYNVAAPVIGTTAPTIQLLVPAGQTIDFEPPMGVAFSAAIVVAATDTSAVLSAVAPATALVSNVIWL